MNQTELRALLERLRGDGENEVVEFKAASTQFDSAKTGEYVSALSNEANLRGADAAWLVFGVSDNKHVAGTTHLATLAHRQKLKIDVYQSTEPSLSIREVHEVEVDGKRVAMLEIPPAPRGMPISWKGDYRARAGESLVPLPLNKLDEIRGQTLSGDWSAAILPTATIAHLDPEAIKRARRGFAERHAARIPLSEIESWSDETFLERARLTRDGNITRAALLLLGKDTATHLLDHPAELTWKLVGEQQAYEHFRTPFLLTASALASRIRNVQLRLMPPNELIYREVSKYLERSILEALYNCIAHQDYARRSRIIVTEYPDRLEFVSVGGFYEGTPEQYSVELRTPREYRNPALVEAMTELNLVDHMGYGIHRMVEDQVKRFLPLPDYDLSDPGEVRLTLHGAVIDSGYSQVLMVNSELPLEDVLALDRVQKGFDITAAAARRLRRLGLLEGRKPNRTITPSVAATTDALADYVRTRPHANSHYEKLIVDFVQTQGYASRKDLDALLLPLLSEALSPAQKRNKVNNLIASMRRSGKLTNRGTRTEPRWEL